MTMMWSCPGCTYLHETEKEQQYLSCAVCGHKRPENATSVSSTTTASSKHVQPNQKRQGSLLQHFGDGGKPSVMKRHRVSSDQSHRFNVSPLESSQPSSIITPNRNILNVLKPQRASCFAPSARYRDNPKEEKDWKTIGNDRDIEKLCPMTLVRDVLPTNIASSLLEQLERDSVNWKQGKWITFGKEHIIPRRTATYNLVPLSESSQSTVTRDAGRVERSVSQDNEEDDEYMDEHRPISAELQQAAKYVTEHVQKHCPWAVTNQNKGWMPTFAFGNRYANGQDCVGWHSDHLTPLGPRPIIVGLTLGAGRRFEMRQQTNIEITNKKDTTCRHVSVFLPHNSLCIMWNDAQESWQHSVPRMSDDGILKHPKVGTVRISLTFREKRKIPGLGNCYCGRPTALRAKDGKYYLFCRPYGKDKHKTCGFWEPCPWAEAEAKRLMALEAFTTRNSR